MTAYWDSQAATFDDQPDHGLRDPRAYAAWRRLLLAHLPPAGARPAPAPAVADVGCGTGSLSVLLAAAGYDVTGLDSAPAMIAAARAKAASAGVSALRRVVPDDRKPGCLFTPSCSRYMSLDIRRYGVWRGVERGRLRLARCVGFAAGGEDWP